MLKCHDLEDHRAVNLVRYHLVEGGQETIYSVAESLDRVLRL